MKKLQLAVFGVTVGFGLACGGSLDTGTLYIPPPTPVGGTASCPPGAISGSTINAGEKVTFVALHPEDAYHGGDTMGRLPQRGKATGGGLTVTDGCWYSGEFEADNGTDSYYFYKAAFVR